MRAAIALLFWFPLAAYCQNWEPVNGDTSKILLIKPTIKSQKPKRMKGFHKHDGFYLSLNYGPALGGFEQMAVGAAFRKKSYSGLADEIDFKIGAAVMENLILSFDIITRSIHNYQVDVDGADGATSNFVLGDEGSALGITYYFMPHNMFINADLGMSRIKGENTAGTLEQFSKQGFSQRIKVGKEWWTGNNWGLGVSAGYGHISAKGKPDPNNPNYRGEFSTNKFFVLFNSTYN